MQRGHRRQGTWFSPCASKARELTCNCVFQVGEKLVSISHSDAGVTTVFASGLKATGSIVIGTDGPQSAVRHILLGPEKAKAQQVEVIMYNMNVTYGNAEQALKVRSLHSMNTVAIQPDKGLSVWTSSKSREIQLHLSL